MTASFSNLVKLRFSYHYWSRIRCAQFQTIQIFIKFTYCKIGTQNLFQKMSGTLSLFSWQLARFSSLSHNVSCLYFSNFSCLPVPFLFAVQSLVAAQTVFLRFCSYLESWAHKIFGSCYLHVKLVFETLSFGFRLTPVLPCKFHCLGPWEIVTFKNSLYGAFKNYYIIYV